MLAINEEFESFQGEGKHTGERQYFVRLQGCDVGCYFCDTKYTWKGGLPTTDETDIMARAGLSKARWICITGGEPLEQDISDLVALAHDHDFKVQIETSGMYWHPVLKWIDWVCVSPKELFAKPGMKLASNVLNYCHELKCVITKPEDIDYYMKEYRDFHGIKTFQPVDSDPKLAQAVLEKSGRLVSDWKVMIQQHKVIDVR